MTDYDGVTPLVRRYEHGRPAGAHISAYLPALVTNGRYKPPHPPLSCRYLGKAAPHLPTFRCLGSVLLVPRVVIYLSVYERPTSYVLGDESHIPLSLLLSRSPHCSRCRVAEGGSLAILCSYLNTPNACHPAPMLP